MKLTSSIFLLALLPLTVMAQRDPDAVAVLSEFSKKAASAPSAKIDFNILVYDAKEDQETETEGTVVISGDNYRLTLPDNLIMADGKTVWNYMPDVKEVTVTEPDPADDSFMSKPSMLFSMYETGYKVRLLEQNPTEWIIDLYPEDVRLNLVRIRLAIGRNLHDLRTAEYKTKDGITLTLKVARYDLTFRPPAGYFAFNPADHKGVEVIDMR
ncbi:MAG TPA: outer membrane lipoprotein carrier protein LolA [Bacteroidales bacterium]|nr:outer membrane lipoprotein carrier protein LolA [Bacteroidales bacterium]